MAKFSHFYIFINLDTAQNADFENENGTLISAIITKILKFENDTFIGCIIL
jgi:hypothetical protein